MKTLKHRRAEYSTGLYDSDTGKDLKTIRAVDVSEECPQSEEPVLLLYTKTKRGEIVQIQHGGARIHYFMEWICDEDNELSALGNFALWAKTTRAHLIELCQKHSPFSKKNQPPARERANQ